MARKSMSALDVEAWVLNTGQRLVGQRLDNAYSLGDLVALRVRGPYGDHLLLQPAVRAHMSSRFRPSDELGGLVRAIRETVRDERIERVGQLGFDRVVEVAFSSGHRLVAELLPRGVVALVSPEGRLIAASSYARMKDRSIARGAEYRAPPLRTSNPFRAGPDELLASMRSSRASDVVRALVLGAGVPGEAAEEAVFRAGVDKAAPPSSLGAGDAERIAEALRAIESEALAGRGYLVLAGGSPAEVDPFRPTRFEGAEVREYGLLDEALDEYFFRVAPAAEPKEEVAAERERLLRSIEESKKQAAQYEAEAEALERQANLVASNYELVARALECAKEGGGCGGIAAVDRKEGYALIDVSGEKVKAYLYETVDDLVKRLYKEAGVLRSKARKAREAEADLAARLAELERRARVARLSAMARQRKRAWYERFHWMVTSAGYLVIGGRDADQNESIVRKLLGDRDLFFHADIRGASAVVLFTGGSQVPEADVEEAGALAAAYSKAWRLGMGSVEVYYVYGSQVSKSPPAGEYITKGSFMVYGRKNYLRPYRLELFLGVALDEEGLPVVVVGPESVVRPQAVSYVRLVPGDRGPEEVARRAIELMAREAGDRGDYVMAVGEDEVLRELPGRSEIAGVRRGEGLGLRRPVRQPGA